MGHGHCDTFHVNIYEKSLGSVACWFEDCINEKFYTPANGHVDSLC